MPIWKSILAFIMTGLIFVATLFTSIFGLKAPSMPACLTRPPAIVVVEPRDPVTIAIDRDELMTLYAGTEFEVVQQCHLEPSAGGTPSDRTYTGVALKNILADNGIDLADIPENATLEAVATDDVSVTYDYELFMDETTLLAWFEDRNNNGSNSDVTRIALKDASSGYFLQNVASLTLDYNDE